MRFEKANSYSKGRGKGNLNKTTKAMKQILTSALFGDEESIARDLALLEPKDRLMVKAKFASYILPTQRSVEVTDMTFDEDSIASRLERFSDEQIRAENDAYKKEKLENRNNNSNQIE